jgi:hypothetical protein
MKAATQLGGFGVKVGDGDSVARFRIADVPTARAVLIELATTGVSRRSGPESAAGQPDLQIP